jgi:lipopolysaccharide export system protein LptA
MRILLAFFLVLGAGFLAGQARAQSAPNDTPALASVTTNSQTRILSDKGLEAYYRVKRYIYHENVRVYNPQMTLTCELLTIERPEVKEGRFDRATADTNVVIHWMDENGTNYATADKAVYTYSITNLATLPEHRFETNALVILSGNAYVTNKSFALRGDPIYWDRVKGVIWTPSLKESVFSPTNSSGIFGTDSGKTNSLRK